MKYFNAMDQIETEIIRLGEMKNLYAVISNGAEESRKEELISALQYMEGSLNDIHRNLTDNYQHLFDTMIKDKI
jgi:hypothetical protein